MLKWFCPILLILNACYLSNNTVSQASLNLSIMPVRNSTAPLNSENFVLSVAVTGKAYSTYKKMELGSSRIIFPAVPMGEEIFVTAAVFPTGAKGGDPLYYGRFPEKATDRYKIEPSTVNISIEMHPLNPMASGGVIYFHDNADGTWDEIHVFTTSPLTPPQTLNFVSPPSVSAEILAVGGGGGGGAGFGGGGGAGALVHKLEYPLVNTVYGITVGKGGNGGAITPLAAEDGATSVFSFGATALVSALGGGGGGNTMSAGKFAPVGAAGDIRGGGGGGGGVNGAGGESVNVPGYGWRGGTGGNNYSGGGGGGMNGAGINGTDAEIELPDGTKIPVGYGGHGGTGLSSMIMGSVTYYSGGGGGGGSIEAGGGGKGGGGKGAAAEIVAADGGNGTDGTGGGGGGAAAGGKGGNGGSGIVIVRFLFKMP